MSSINFYVCSTNNLSVNSFFLLSFVVVFIVVPYFSSLLYGTIYDSFKSMRNVIKVEKKAIKIKFMIRILCLYEVKKKKQKTTIITKIIITKRIFITSPKAGQYFLLVLRP